MRRLAAMAVIVASAFFGTSAAADAAKPLPVNRTQIVKDGTFYVEGRARIAAGVEITIQKNTKIVAKDAEAVIEVEGRLTVQGNSAAVVVFEGVTVELQPKFEEILLNTMEFRGKSKGIVTKDEALCDGRVRLIDVTFNDQSTLRTVLTNTATVDLRGLQWFSRLELKAAVAPGAKASGVKLAMKECRAQRNWNSALRVDGFASVEIRASELGGDDATFVDCGSVAIDACYLFCKKVGFDEPVSGRWGACKIQNCDLHCKEIVLASPEAANPEKMKIEYCWFAGETVVSAIKQKFITDHDKDPKIGVCASVERPAGKALQLTWTIMR